MLKNIAKNKQRT